MSFRATAEEVRVRVSPAAGSTALAAGVLALTVAFLAEHRGEIASLHVTVPALATAIGRHGIVNLAGAAQAGAGATAATLVVVAWYGLGDLVTRSIARAGSGRANSLQPHSRALDLARTFALGAGAWSLIWFALGLAGLYRPAAALAAAACGLVLATRALVSRAGRQAVRHAIEGPPTRTAAVRAAALLTALPVALALVAALAPPTAKDALQYHLALPKAYLAAQGLVDVPGNIANYFALGTEMHGAWAMLLGRIAGARAGEAAFGAVTFAFFPLLVAAVLGWARERGLGDDWAWLAAAMVVGTPTAWEVAGSGYVDLALALYVTLMIRAVARWWDTQERSDLFEAAVAMAFALAVKFTAAFLPLVFVLIVLLRTRAPAPGGAEPRPLTIGLAALAGALVLGCPWYVRTWVRTGSPVFPFFAGVWPGQAPGWDLERSTMLVGFNALYGGDKGLLGYLLTPLTLSVAGQREVAASYEGVLGVSFLAGAALIVWALSRRVLGAEWKIAAASGGALFVWWLASAQVLRYLFPALPLVAVAAAGAGAALSAAGAIRPWLRWVLAAPIAAGEIVIVAWFVADNPLLAATGAEPREAYLERRLDYYPYFRLINDSLPSAATIWLVDVRRDTYHLERPYLGDYLFEDYTLRKWVEAAATGREVQRHALAAGITHVLIRHDILLDPAHSPLVDARLPAAENQARLERLRDFLLDGVDMLRADRTFALIGLHRADSIRISGSGPAVGRQTVP